MANQKGKTEHSGAKHGNGAYWGRKADAKQESNRQRREVGKSYTAEELEALSLDGDDIWALSPDVDRDLLLALQREGYDICARGCVCKELGIETE